MRANNRKVIGNISARCHNNVGQTIPRPDVCISCVNIFNLDFNVISFINAILFHCYSVKI